MFELSKFNEYREDNRREVKKARKGLPDSLWSTYSAFANCYGGVIILGVEENADGSWSTTGLQGEGKLQKDFWNNINNPQKVSHNLLTEQDVRTYQLGEDTMDMKVLDNMQLDVLNMETVHAYRNRHMAYRSEHVWEQLKDADYLERIGAAKWIAQMAIFIQLRLGY